MRKHKSEEVLNINFQVKKLREKNSFKEVHI